MSDINLPKQESREVNNANLSQLETKTEIPQPAKLEIKTWTELYNYFPSLLTDKKIDCNGCKDKKIGREKLIFCSENCFVRNWIKDHGYLREKELVLSHFKYKLDKWDDEAEKEGGFTKEEWRKIRQKIDNLPPLTEEFLKQWERQQKKERKKQKSKHGQHKDKYYIQNHYREQVLKEEMEKRNWTIADKPFQEQGKLKDNLIIFGLRKVVEQTPNNFAKKWCIKNGAFSSYIYKTCFFSYTPKQAGAYDREELAENKNCIISHYERNKNNNTSNDNFKEKQNKNNSSNTKTNESLKNKQITVDYSNKNNF